MFASIDTISDVTSLRDLVTPTILNSPTKEAYTYKFNLDLLPFYGQIAFNHHPTVLRGDLIIPWIKFLDKLVSYLLAASDDEIVLCEPSLDVLFDDIIRDPELKAMYDPRLS